MPRNKSTSVHYRPPLSEVLGRQYGQLTVLRQVDRPSHRKDTGRFVLCQCTCGADYIGPLARILKGDIVSCGRNVHKGTHGHQKDGKPTHVHNVWRSMVQRTTNPNSPDWPNYGGRGITTTDPRWFQFEDFLADMGEPPTLKHTLDRRDNERGYCKANCSWELPSHQNRHYRQNRFVTFKDQTKCVIEWSETTGLSHATISYRLNVGWSVEDALTTPLVPRGTKHRR